MGNNSGNTKRIIKNTGVLYVRMIFTMVLTLFSSRIVLKALGVEDFGLYNVVGGVVALISFLRSSLTSSTQRFISFELGRKDFDRLKKVFSVSLSTHIIICLAILLIAETLGLWFVNSKMQIPDDRLIAANWVYQFAVLSLCVSTFNVPYAATVISHEKMTFYAVVSVFEAVLKLAIAYALFVTGGDRLIWYGALMLLIAVIHLLMYWAYCRSKFAETKYSVIWDNSLFKQIFSFSGWTILGQLAVIAANQGTSVLINMYYSLVANAAVGVAQQVNGAITGLTANFQTAFQPQITKSYAEKDYNFLNNLIAKASKISFLLMFVVAVPILMNIDAILDIWLGDVPESAGVFCILFIIASLFNAISAPLWIAIFATGKIRSYQIAVSITFLSDLVIVYLLFHYFNLPATVSMMVKAVINLVVIFVRLYYAKHQISQFNWYDYLMNVVFRNLLIFAIISLLVIYINSLRLNLPLQIIATIIIELISIISLFFIGFTREEQKSSISLIKKIVKR